MIRMSFQIVEFLKRTRKAVNVLEVTDLECNQEQNHTMQTEWVCPIYT